MKSKRLLEAVADIHNLQQVKPVDETNSTKGLKKILDEAVEMIVFFSQVPYLLERVDHCGVVLSPKTSTDLRERGVGQRLT